jgi:hypothetical protein
MPTKSAIQKRIELFIETEKNLKAEISRLKKSNAAYSNNSKANASMIATAKKLLKVEPNEAWLQSLNNLIESNKRNELNKTDSRLIEELCNLFQCDVMSTPQSALIKAIKALRNDYFVCLKNERDVKRELELNSDATAEDILTRIKKLKLNIFPNNTGLKIRQLIGISPDTSTQQMVDRVNELVNLYNEELKNGTEIKESLDLPKNAVHQEVSKAIRKLVFDEKNATSEIYMELCEILGITIGTIKIDKLIEKVKDLKESNVNPFYINVCDAMKLTPGINPNSVIEKIKELSEISKTSNNPFYRNVCNAMEEKNGIHPAFLIKKIREQFAKNYTLKFLEMQVSNALEIDGNIADAIKAIKNLKLDLAAAREQEDKNALEVNRLKKLNLELQAEVNECKTMSYYKLAVDAFAGFKKDVSTMNNINTPGLEEYNMGLLKELRESNNALMKECNKLTDEKHNLKIALENLNKPPVSITGAKINELVGVYRSYQTNIDLFKSLDSVLQERCRFAIIHKELGGPSMLNHILKLNNQISQMLGIPDYNK